MDWLLLGGLGIIWAAFLLPSGGRRTSPTMSIDEFAKDMDILADTEGEGRWVVTPQKGVAFVGAQARQRARVLDRRRTVLAFLVEATLITFLIGLFPPLRSMWIATSGFGLVLFGFCWLLIRLKMIESGSHGVASQVAADHRVGAVAQQGPSAGHRYVADRAGRVARSSYAGLATFSEEDVHVVLRHPE